MSRLRSRPLRAGVLAGILLLAVTACGGPVPGSQEPGLEGVGAVAQPGTVTEPAPCVADRPGEGAGGPAPSPAGSAAAVLPDLVLDCLGGGPPVALRSLDGPAVLTLWASWCGPCRREMPAFVRLSESVPQDELRVWGVLSEDVPDAATDFVVAAGVSFPSLVDPDGKVRKALPRPGLPVTVLVAEGGHVVHVHTGPALNYDEMRDMVRRHLGVVV